MANLPQGRAVLRRGASDGMGERQSPQHREGGRRAGWRDLGYEVLHESKALFKAIFADPATKNGTRVTCFFGLSQVQAINA